MSTKQLRLGNLLEVDGVVIEVGKINEKHISWNVAKNSKFRVWNPYISIDDDRIKPIPLTENFLLNNWFRKCEEWESWFEYDNIRNNGIFSMNIRLMINIESGHCGIRNFDFTDLVTMLQTNIYYIHQLQNLHHAITGQEFIIKQKTK